MKLTTWERVQLIATVGGAQGTIAQVRLGLKALDALQLSDEEKKSIGWLETPTGQVIWRTVGQEWEIELEDWNFVKDLVNRRQTWPIDQRTLDLLAKFSE